jgi:hypothetical protein
MLCWIFDINKRLRIMSRISLLLAMDELKCKISSQWTSISVVVAVGGEIDANEKLWRIKYLNADNKPGWKCYNNILYTTVRY